MKMYFYLVITFTTFLSCKKGPDGGTACVKSYIDAKKITTMPLSDGIPGGTVQNQNSSSLIAGGFFNATAAKTAKSKATQVNCTATVIFNENGQNTEIEILTANHCAASNIRGPFKLLISGKEGFRELQISVPVLENGSLIYDSIQNNGILSRLENIGLTYRPFEQKVLRDKIANSELSSSIVQELSSYGGHLCGSGTKNPSGINAFKVCFMFSELVSLKATVLPGQENAFLSIKKGGNTATNFISSAPQNWMEDIRLRLKISKEYELGRALSTVYDCNLPEEQRAFSTTGGHCTPDYTSRTKAFIQDLETKNLLAGSIFAGYSRLSEAAKLTAIKASIDNLAKSYGSQVKFWQSQRQRMQKGSLTLASNYVVGNGAQYKVAALKDFQGTIPFIWRPYGILAYMDKTFATLQKGVSGSIVFLDGTPMAILSKIDGDNTSSGAAIGKPLGEEQDLSSLPSAPILTASQWQARESTATASAPVIVVPPTSQGQSPSIPQPVPGPTVPGPVNNRPSPAPASRQNADFGDQISYGGVDSGC